MKGMPALVQQRLNVAVHVYRVHEDKGTARDGESDAEAARRLVLPAVEVQELLLSHDVELFPETRVDLAEDRRGPLRKLVDMLEGLERVTSRRIDVQVPGSQSVHTQSILTGSEASSHRRDDDIVDRLVECEHVLRTVVEPA